MRKASVVAAIMAAAIGLEFCAQYRRAMPAAPATEQAEESRAAREEARAAVRALEEASARARNAGGAASRAQMPTSTANANAANAASAASAAATTPSGLPTVLSDAWSDGKFAGFTREELADMAGRCELRWQLPHAPDEKYVAAVRGLYAELIGTHEVEVSLREMSDTLRIDSDDDATATHRRLAAQRAGDAVTPTGSVYERYLQLQLDESERAARDGVALGPKYTLTGCAPGSAIFRSTR